MGSEQDRIAKVIARRGYCSRRAAEVYIQNGQVSVHGKKIIDPATRISYDAPIIINGSEVPNATHTRLWIFHKPKGCLTTAHDPQDRKTIFDFLPGNLPQHLIPIGRLDFNSEGLLLLTNDGKYAETLMHPRSGLNRTYEVDAFGILSDKLFSDMKKGILIDQTHYRSIGVKILKSTKLNHRLKLTLTEGKNREIRRILEHFELKVKRLKRISYGPYHLGKLASGSIIEIDLQNL